ncbi:HNH endonuclease [Phocaeicola vulgatus]|jgi:hypothetical protein|nr:HNH endonuclease [Phocaeicola vulgatus]
MCKKGYCIICHQDNQELSDEHVIPEAIGGYYHIYNVCKDCNSKLGDHVDNLLLNHWFIKAARHEKGLKGYKGYIPNPLVGEGSLPTGEKVRVEQDNDGKMSIRFIPTSPEVSDDGKFFKIQVDAKDEKTIPNIKTKILKRHNIDETKVQIVSDCQLVKIEHPEVRMQFTIDIKNYKIGLLKIAYEFAADRIEGYIDDPISKLYASILHEGNPDRLDEVFFEGDAINNASLNIMESIIDNSNTNRHILLLANIHNKLYCIVKLFDKFCQMIRMSDSSYGEDGLVLLAINDFVNHKCDFYSPTDLIRVTNYSEFTTFKLNDEDQAYLDSLLRINKEGIGFACNKDQDNILFDSKGIPICTESILLLTLERLNLIKEESHTSGKISATYKIPLGYYYLCMPDKKLLMVKEITKVNEFIKI